MKAIQNPILCTLVVAGLGAASQPAAAAVYELRAASTTVTMADGRVVPMWGFGLAANPTVSIPGPELELPPGDDTLVVNLTNDLPVPLDPTGLTRRWLNVLLIAGALGLGTIQGLYDSHSVIHFDTFPNRMADLVKQHTAASEKVLMRGGGWGGEVFFLAGRDGLSIWDTKPLEDPATYARLKSLGYTKLVMISETPLLTAIRDAYSPNARLERESYKISMTPIVDTLPTVLQSEDILIKELK